MIRIISAILICAVALGAGLYIGRFGLSAPSSQMASVPERVILYSPPRSLGDFTLTGESGQPVNRDAFKDQWTVMYFGFTHCPDICPESLTLLNKVSAQLKGDGVSQKVRYMLLSVDPERDTPARLKDYVKYFNTDFAGATGTVAQVQAFTKSVGVVAIKVEDQLMPGGYTVDHSSVFALINPAGDMAGLITAPHTVSDVVAGVKAAIERFNG